MIRTLIQYSQRFAGLMLLAALAVNATPAQSQNKKAVLEKQPATKVIKIQPKETANKSAERILEAEKSPADLKRVRDGIAVGEPTGGSPKKEAIDAIGGKQRGGNTTGGKKSTENVLEQRGIAVGERTGQLQDGTKKIVVEPGTGIGRVVDVPQKTKDAVGSPQRGEQKPDGTLKRVGKEKASEDLIRKLPKLKGGVTTRNPKELEAPGQGATDLKCRSCSKKQLEVPNGISPKVPVGLKNDQPITDLKRKAHVLKENKISQDTPKDLRKRVKDAQEKTIERKGGTQANSNDLLIKKPRARVEQTIPGKTAPVNTDLAKRRIIDARQTRAVSPSIVGRPRHR